MDHSLQASDQSFDAIATNIVFDKQIPVYGYQSKDQLMKRERQLSKFFKCCPNAATDDHNNGTNECFFATNDAKEFEQHLQRCHQKVCCIYCLLESRLRSGDSGADVELEVDVFETTDCQSLIDHMIQTHGKRVYQCNRCLFRAITCGHIQMHQISRHTHIWSEHNSKLKIDSLEELNEDICKIIVCKDIDTGSIVEPLSWISKLSPDLDTLLDDDKSYCLYCDFNDKQMVNVLIHCHERHPDFAISVYNKELEDIYALNDEISDESDAVAVVSDDDSSDTSDSDVECEANTGPKPATVPFKTQCTTECMPDIPGLSDDFLAPRQLPTKRRLPFGGNRRPPKPYNEYTEYRPPVATPNVSQFASIPDTFDMDFSRPITPITPIPLTSTPVNRVPIQHINHIINKSTNKKSPKKFVDHDSPKPQDPPLLTGYRAHKLQKYGTLHVPNKRKNKHKNKHNSTPNNPSTISTDEITSENVIDIGMIYGDLHSGSDDETSTRTPSFKVIKRVGVQTPKGKSKTPAFTYVPRRDESDDYVNLVNEAPVPKRGLKARFENQHHFQLIIPGVSDQKLKHMYKCVLCPHAAPFHQTNRVNHLRTEHNSDSSFKCGYCHFIGSRDAIKEHSKVSHPSLSVSIHTFIISVEQTSSIGLTNEASIKKLTARKSTALSTGLVSKGGKGALTQKILNTNYVDLGPLGGDRMGRKRSIASAESQPFSRVHNRSTHSSNIKRKKLESNNDMEFEENEDSDDMQLNDESDSMQSDVESDANPQSDPQPDPGLSSGDEDIEEVISPKKQTVARKSTAKPCSQSLNESMIAKPLEESEIPSKFLCVFCDEGFIINDKWEAIEHYKSHLGLGYACSQCHFKCVAYNSMENHWHSVHKSDDMDFVDNMTEEIRSWIINCIDNQFKSALFVEPSALRPNPNGIDIVCPICVKAAKVCKLSAAPFDALWKAKLHICKHLFWFPMKCDLCPESHIFPDNPFILMKHLIDSHFKSCENLYNIAFRGQKPFNDMKREQIRLIERNFTSIRVFSSDIINSFFRQLMTTLDLIYENQLRAKFRITKEARIELIRYIQVKSEPIDDDDGDEGLNGTNSGVKQEDKKDIKFLIKNEIKNEVKSEVKAEVKNEIKNETKNETKDEPMIPSEDNFLERLFGPTPGSENDVIEIDSDDD